MSGNSSLSYKDCLSIEEQLIDLKNGKGNFSSPRYGILEYWLFEMKPKDLYKRLSRHSKPEKIVKIIEDYDIIGWMHYYFLCIYPSIVKFEDCKGVCKHDCILWFFSNDEERKYIDVPDCIQPVQRNWVFRDKPNKYQGWYYKQLLIIKKLEYQLLKFIWVYKKFKKKANENKHITIINSILADIELIQLIVDYVDNKITNQEMINKADINIMGKIDDYTNIIGNKKCKTKNITGFRKKLIENREIPKFI